MSSWFRVAALALLWGSTFLWIEVALTALTPVQVTLARCLLGSATLLVVCFGAGHRLPGDRQTWRHVTVAAFFCNALPFALFSVGQQTVDSGVAGVLNATTPLWSLLIGIAVGTERSPRPLRLAGLLLGFLGVVVIFAPWQAGGIVGWGALAIVGAAASYAVAFAYMDRHLVGRGMPTISLSAAQLLAATGLTALALPAGGLAPIGLDPAALAGVVVLGVAATGVTFHLTYRIIAAEGATNAATVGYLLPVVSVALGALVLDEAFSPRIAAGMVVVLAGVALSRRAVPAPEPATAV
ncbi:DMT family transporter [Asanoa sp. WMMD1127]|uniref:DMT family transporter n=1 Tax=Asanoa sp. WMMD1127 TaxID=3016107 RepID=UPI0024161682|nr:DMT family transporter [Asanoa sp. WMMD1127]MDG4823225.1 DMT family transporter [Asanoa sp. WMMD1127]